MVSSEYIKIYRSEVTDCLFEDLPLYFFWVWLRMMAATKARVQLVGNTRKRVKVETGQYATSITALAQKWKMDTRTIDCFLNLLSEDGRITMQKDGNVTIIGIVNFDKFVSKESDALIEKVNLDESNPMSDEVKRLFIQLKEEMKETLMAEWKTSLLVELQKEMLNMMHEEKRNQMQAPMQIGMPDSMQPTTAAPMQKTTQVKAQNHTTSPIVVEEDKKLNNNSSAPALRERELEFYENLKKADDATMASIANTLKLPDKDAVLNWLEKFWDFILSSGRVHKDQLDFNTNFLAWYPKVANRHETTNSKANGRNEEKQGVRRGSAAARRGSEGSAQSADDYDAPFPTEG